MRKIVCILGLLGIAVAFSGSAAGEESAAAVLEKARQAFGGAEGVLVMSGSERISGLSGRRQDIEDLHDGRNSRSSDFSMFRYAEVLNDTGYWRQDHSGGVHRLNSTFALEHSATEAWLAKRGFLQGNLDGAKVSYKGVRISEGRSFDVVSAMPVGGQEVQLWFDQRTGLLAKSVWTMPISIDTTSYDDYRRVGGLMVPFKESSWVDESSDVDVFTVEQATIASRSSPADFAPPTTPDDSTVEGGAATVPIEFEGDVIIEAKLNGQGPYGFILDTGGHDIVTPEVAKALHLEAQGAGYTGGAGEGTLPLQYARVERVDIGGVTLRNQPFYVIPLQYDTVERDPKPPLAGIMGIELFERFAMQLDYQHRTLTLRPLAGAPEGQGTPVPIYFADDIPLYKARIEGLEGDIGLDTGNNGSLEIQWRWADAYGLGDRLRDGYPTSGFGLGGTLKSWISRVDLSVAGIDFPGTLTAMGSDKRGAFSSRTEAGNVGNDIYQNFTLDFDYARNMVWFAPGKRMPPPPPAATGLSTYKKSAAAFTVAAVAPNTPASEAGLAPDDEIVAVNGVPANQISGYALTHILRSEPGAKVTLDVMHDGQKRTVTLVRRILIP